MSLAHDLLIPAYHAVRLGQGLRRGLGGSEPDALRVLLYHDVAGDAVPAFERQLRWLQRRWKFIGPREFEGICGSGEKVRGRRLFLTFDDGYASNRVVAERVLRPMGIHAAFFVISDFVPLRDPATIRDFIASRIIPGTDPRTVSPEMRNMTRDDLAALLEQGHLIGAHTRTHARLSALSSRAELEREIVASANALSASLGVPVDHFAWPFGDMASMSETAFAVCRGRFRFVYSGLRGDNSGLRSAHAVRRDAVTPRDPRALVGAFTEGLVDRRYAPSRTHLDQMAGC